MHAAGKNTTGFRRSDPPPFSPVRLPWFKAGDDALRAKHINRTFSRHDPHCIGCAPVQRSILDPYGVLPVKTPFRISLFCFCGKNPPVHRTFGEHDFSDTCIPQPIEKKQQGNKQYK